MDLEVHGERGALFLRDGQLSFSERPRENFGTRPVHPVQLEADLNETGVLRDFYRYIAGEGEPGVSVRRNLEVMALCEMTVRSITGRRPCAREELDS